MPSAPADYLSEVSSLLWPSPASYELLVLPRSKRPRIVVPSGRRAGAAALRRYGEPGSARTRLATRALATMLAGGLGRLVGGRLSLATATGGEPIESYLAALLGQPVQISMHVGAARANRKPVLQLLTPSGDTVGFAKIGVNALTADLVRAERAALSSLAGSGISLMRLPRVLGSGCWNGLEVLVLSALPVWRRRTPLPERRLREAMGELASVDGLRSSALPGSPYWERLTGGLRLAPYGAERDRLASALERLAVIADGTELSFGSWHGDLTPWNLAHTGAGLLVWDWERFCSDVPVGFDALHYRIQARVVRAEDPLLVAGQCADEAAGLLAPFGVGRAQARLTALLYLAELSVRYLADRQEEAGARLGAPRRWLLPALEAGVAGG
ncbi:MAG TPA: hypothetical protein VMA95_16370 [Streptosporangiaceae bacterium]|nr:hypothetical protein [Streptosporangiaceae bacterium]